MAVWMVRAGKQGEHESLALEKGIVAIGWDDMPDLSHVDTRQKLRSMCEQVYPSATKSKISNLVGQLWNFRERIRKNDLVAMPLKTRSAIALGRIVGDYEYKKANPYGAKHTRAVKWIRNDLPRGAFGQDLLYSLGAIMTVCSIQRNDAEARFEAILKTGTDPDAPPTDTDVHEIPSEPPFDFEQYSRDKITSYINARFQGHRFADLVAALLSAQGYHTQVSPPGPDSGADIIAGRGPMGFDPPRLCVQVKSGHGPEGVKTLHELQGVMKNFGADQGLLVSWGGFTDSVYREARKLFFDVRLWDAGQFVEALLASYEKLSDEVQAELPLKRVWIPVPED